MLPSPYGVLSHLCFVFSAFFLLICVINTELLSVIINTRYFKIALFKFRGKKRIYPNVQTVVEML